MIATMAGFTTGLSAPPVPQISYTAAGQFTITNYNSSLTYVVSGATRSGSLLSSVSNGATITATYSAGAPVSNASTMNVQAHGRVLTSVVSTPFSVGCSPRGNITCPGGSVLGVDGATSGGAPGTQGCFYQCEGNCSCGPNGPCFGLFVTCYNSYITDYSGSGYTLIGSIWGKATNG